ncbi:MAG: MFS transporter, partial [Spirochaetales bacterium]|nr:MFS transporter [Spirochaetales bacterium]
SRARLVGLLTGIIFLSMLSRLVFSPLLVYIQDEFVISQSQAGSVFLIIALGYSPGMLFSGFLTVKMRHRGVIILSLFMEALGLVVAALSPSFSVMCLGVWLIGIGSGIYPPSGIASITETVSARRRGMALAIHEIGPNVAFFAAPLLALFFYHRLGWRGILLIVVCLNLFTALLYARRGTGGDSRGKTPQLSRLLAVAKLREAWFIFGLFCIALCAVQGVFAILPMFLIKAKGLDPDTANKLVSVSRISGIFILLVSGSLVDAFGARRVILTAFLVSGAATVFLGLAQGGLLIAAIIVQPSLMTAFFPAGLLIISQLGPPDSRNVTFSFIVNLAVLIGNGIMPTFFGFLGDLGVQPIGFGVLAAVTLFSAVCVYRARSFGSAAPPPRAS